MISESGDKSGSSELSEDAVDSENDNVPLFREFVEINLENTPPPSPFKDSLAQQF